MRLSRINFICSNETNRRSLQSHWRRLHSSCLHLQVLNTDLWRKKRWMRSRKRIGSPPNASALWQPKLKAPFCESFEENLSPAPVSTDFLSFGVNRIPRGEPSQLSDNYIHFHADDEFFDYAKTLTPAAVDLEMRSLVTTENLKSFMIAIIRRLRSRRDFEAVQTYQNIFLRIHGEALITNPELLETMERLLSIQKAESEAVLDLVTSSMGTLDFVREVL